MSKPDNTDTMRRARISARAYVLCGRFISLAACEGEKK